MSNSGISSISLSSDQRSGISAIEREVFCTACKLVVKNLAEFKIHFASDFHRYNSKRRVIGLEPVNLEKFQVKKETRTSSQASSTGKKNYGCSACNKHFATQAQLQNHLASKKHIKNLKSKKVEAIVEEDSSDLKVEKNDGETVTSLNNPRVCLFCNKASAGLKMNLDHMKKAHSFIFLEPQAILSIKRLLMHMAQKIQIGHQCLLCARQFKCPQAVQDHMMEKGHCFMNVDNFEIEYEDFYDFSKSYIGQGCLIDVLKELKAIQEGYPDEHGEVLKIEKDTSEVKTPSKKESTTSFTIVGEPSDFSLQSSAKKSESSGFVIVGESSEINPKIEEEEKEEQGEEDNESDEEWEDIDLEDAENDSATPSSQNLREMEESSDDAFSHSAVTPVKGHVPDINDMPQILPTGQIRLPGGKILGHRAFKHIYKQNYRPAENRESVLLNKLALEYRQINGTVMKSLQNGVLPHGGIKLDKVQRTNQKEIVDRLKKKALKIGSFHHKLQHGFRDPTAGLQ